MKILRMLACSLVVSSQVLLGQIHEVRDLELVRESARALQPGDLLVFDIDYTLTMPEHPAFHPSNFYPCLKGIKQLDWPESPEFKQFLVCYMVARGSSLLIDPLAREIIIETQGRGVHVMALTGTVTCPLGFDLSPLEKRREQLDHLGLDLSCGWDEGFWALSYSGEGIGDCPEFERGILCGNCPPEEKGDVLAAFFADLGFSPERVVFIDDKLGSSTSIADAMASMGVALDAFHYRGAEDCATVELERDQVLEAWELLMGEARLVWDFLNG